MHEVIGHGPFVAANVCKVNAEEAVEIVITRPVPDLPQLRHPRTRRKSNNDNNMLRSVAKSRHRAFRRTRQAAATFPPRMGQAMIQPNQPLRRLRIMKLKAIGPPKQADSVKSQVR